MKKSLLLLVFLAIVLAFWSARRPRPVNSEVSPELVLRSPRLADLLSAEDLQGYAIAGAPRGFVFPEDHGPHPDYRNEWWYITGNLDGEGNERFGFELTLFRFSVAPAIEEDSAARQSRWRSNQVYIGHFAISDLSTGQFHVAQRYSRGGAGLAGAQSGPLRVWLEDWALSDASAGSNRGANSAPRWRLRAADEHIAIDLTLRPQKSPVLNGDDGLSKKSAVPGNASYYYSIPRLRTIGTLRSGDKTYRVSGQSWLDREWGSSGLSKEQEGWDWFALQLSDGSDLMFYHLRRNDGTQDMHSAGTYIAADGSATRLARRDVSIDVLEHWDSPHGGRYPMAWRIEIASLNLDLQVMPMMVGQELLTLVRYWEGAVDVRGSRDDQKIRGRGYVELTGYADERAITATLTEGKPHEQ